MDLIQVSYSQPGPSAIGRETSRKSVGGATSDSPASEWLHFPLPRFLPSWSPLCASWFGSRPSSAQAAAPPGGEEGEGVRGSAAFGEGPQVSAASPGAACSRDRRRCRRAGLQGSSSTGWWWTSRTSHTHLDAAGRPSERTATLSPPGWV